MCHRCGRTLWKLFQKLTKRVCHSLFVFLLAEDERLALERFLPLARTGILAQYRVPVGQRRAVIFVALECFGPDRQGRGRAWIVRKRLYEITECIDDAWDVFHLQVTRAQLVGR